MLPPRTGARLHCDWLRGDQRDQRPSRTHPCRRPFVARRTLLFHSPFHSHMPAPRRPRFTPIVALLAALAAAPVAARTVHAQGPLPTKGTGTVVLRAARLIDGTGAAPVQNGV